MNKLYLGYSNQAATLLAGFTFYWYNCTSALIA